MTRRLIRTSFWGWCEHPWPQGVRSGAPASTAQGRWCALVERASPPQRRLMRSAIRSVLGTAPRAEDDAMALAAQLDRRTAEELAVAYLRAYVVIGGDIDSGIYGEN